MKLRVLAMLVVLSCVAVFSVPTADAADAAEDLSAYITGVSMQYRLYDGGNWQDLHDGEELQNGAQVQFTMHYQVPQGKLQKTVTYQIPRVIGLTSAELGTVYNSLGQRMGTYTIAADGLVTIVYDDATVAGNQNSAIEGSLAFHAAVSDINNGNSGTVDLPFSSSETIHVKIGGLDDISVYKAATKIDDKGTVVYTVTVTSVSGTASDVNLSDILTENTIQGGSFDMSSIKAVDGSGNTVPTMNVTLSSGSMAASLPKMGKNSLYKITYTVHAPLQPTGVTKVGNNATASSTNGDGDRISGNYSTTTEFGSSPTVTKTGTLQISTHSVLWTIAINANGNDLSGWTLSDTPGQGISLPPAVTLMDTTAGATSSPQQIRLPYTFPQGTGNRSYTVTYETAAPNDGTSATNHSSLAPPSGDTSSAISGDSSVNLPNLLSKTHGAIVAQPDGTVALNWTVSIAPTLNDLSAGWAYDDLMNWGSGDQYLTKDQQHVLVAAVDQAFHQQGLQYPTITFRQNRWDTSHDYMAGELDWATYFVITSPDGLPVGKRIQVSYTSTGKGTATWFDNSGNAGGFSVDSGLSNDPDPVPTHSSVKKYDPSDPSGADTKHTLQSLSTTSNGTSYLTWAIDATIDSNNRDRDVTITEKLPAGTRLLSVQQDGITGLHLDANIPYSDGGRSFTIGGDLDNSGSQTISGYNYNVNANERYTIGVASGPPDAQGNTTVTIVVPKALASALGDGTLSLGVRVAIPDVGLNDAVSYRNCVLVHDSGETWQKEDSQQQTITNDGTYDALEKSVERTDDQKNANIVPYTLKINPHGYDLLADADTLTLTDQLTYIFNPWYGRASVALVPGSVILYHMNPDGGQGAPLDPGKYSYEYSTAASRADSEGKINNTDTLKIRVPDGMPIVAQYQYKYFGDSSTWMDINNVANLSGIASAHTEGHTEIHDASNIANFMEISLYKTDAADNGIYLQGAVFDLYRFTGAPTNDGYELQRSGLTTNANGKVSLALGTIAYNTAYRVVERKAPNGYSIDTANTEFLVRNIDTTAYPIIEPSDFNGQLLNVGSPFFITDSKLTSLPQTGGTGIRSYVGMAVAAEALALGVYLAKRRNRI